MAMKKNHLAFSLSPYLLQHQYNPVDWYPWSEEALKKAHDEDKPIFLSIGYSACHWCHVMERESFEDPNIAKLLNDYFINIKVDREERPDLDHLYMSCVQAMTGQGGWPLSVFMAPDLKPFFAGTYFPPSNLYGMPSFRSFLLQIIYAWKNNRVILLGSSAKVFDYLRQEEKIQQELRGPLSKEILETLVAECLKEFDPEWGGFGSAPKFPQTGVFFALLRQYHHQRNPQILEMITRSLSQMAQGGIYDQVGGGFHRYSVDEKWLVPHFEKMLYDNALLSRLYLEAYQVTKQKPFLSTALQTLHYLLQELRHPLGAFYSAEDADSAGEEGAYYVWTLAEIEEILPDPHLFCRVYGVTEVGNFEEKNILVQTEPVESLSQENQEKLASERELLKKARSKRMRPNLDDAILLDWNALTISSLTKAYQITREASYLDAAQKAVQFIENNMTKGDELYHLWRQTLGDTLGFLDDYAGYILALLDLYECDFNVNWLKRAKRLLDKMVELFWDGENGAFFSTSFNHNAPLLRTKTFNDDAIPSGNALAAMALLKLSCYFENQAYYVMAEKILYAHAIIMPKAPQWYGTMLCALDTYFSSLQQIVLKGNYTEEKVQEFLQVIYHAYLPHKVVAICGEDGSIDVPLCQNKPGESGQAHVCYQGRCLPPIAEASRLHSILLEKN